MAPPTNGRISVETTSQTESTYGTLSATNSNAYISAATPSTSHEPSSSGICAEPSIRSAMPSTSTTR